MRIEDLASLPLFIDGRSVRQKGEQISFCMQLKKAVLQV